ncbi:MAG: cytochrome c biogenesis protein CcdA [Deferribacterota bacterium]|nr:cytochrome c biogenesis protein CcdA [Deferribacterota bacterium]
MNELTIVTVFLAGFLSFLSPCILPLIPAYISFISGENLYSLTESSRKIHVKAIIGTIFFGLGFTTVFVAMGASATWIGSFFVQYKYVLSKVAGVIIVIFGLHLLGFFKFNLLKKQYKVNYKKGNSPYYIESFLLGLAFVLGWTPCIGPILGSILAVAATEETINKGIFLLSVYSAGLWVPFLITAVFLSTCLLLIKKYSKVSLFIEKASGILLIFMGILIFTNALSYLATFFS